MELLKLYGIINSAVVDFYCSKFNIEKSIEKKLIGIANLNDVIET